ncbi:hypothetical protein [Micromonospora cathayae]|uniref:AAA+ ATPase domain-containing protein n=1 Tax=Micromonospora cathayae TaxID=3028804 RepID=A0ABY7ZKH7_9ACTN|nr:hypothetical protein [Micromonospora sp. HUAS 3]WDZ83387.1 hypothetical protein PVK37_23405 [Micromonospora sp. HUAS 3]
MTPLIAWPRRVEVGRDYLVTVDLSFPPDQWPYQDEELSLGCLLEGAGQFVVESYGETSMILHRFGGTYGPVRFVVRATATDREQTDGALWLTLVTAGGVPTTPIRLPVSLTRVPVDPLVDGGDDPADETETPAPPLAPPPTAAPEPSEETRPTMSGTNPFATPMTLRPLAPLDPLRYPYHLSCYVPVGDTEVAFDQFRTTIGAPEDLRLDGRMVVVSGPGGCGKTSLINRCAQWLTEGSGTGDLHPVVLDLRRVGQPRQPTAERMAEVWDYALYSLESQRLLVGEPDALRGRTAAYSLLRSILVPDVLVVALLPPMELPAEMVRYARQPTPQVVFFMENSSDQRHTLGRDAATPPIDLAVRGVTEREAERFVHERLGQTAEPLPRIAPGVIAQYVSLRKHVSVGELQRLLFGVYQEALEAAVPPDEITFDHLARYFLRVANALPDDPR